MTQATGDEKVCNKLTSEDQITVLKQKHASLESALNDENNRPMPDASTLAHIKREKLAIKDELERLVPH
jgi:hypothetical protein